MFMHNSGELCFSNLLAAIYSPSPWIRFPCNMQTTTLDARHRVVVPASTNSNTLACTPETQSSTLHGCCSRTESIYQNHEPQLVPFTILGKYWLAAEGQSCSSAGKSCTSWKLHKYNVHECVPGSDIRVRCSICYFRTFVTPTDRVKSISECKSQIFVHRSSAL